jgi:hypothetical protein
MIAKYKAVAWFSLFVFILGAVCLGMYAITGDWSQSLTITIFGFPIHLTFLVFGSGCIIKGFFHVYERPVVKAAIKGEQPKDGHRIGIFGKIEPREKPVYTPFGQKQCVGYKYIIQYEKHLSGSDTHSSSQHLIIASGWALAPARIFSDTTIYSIHGFPLIEDFTEEGKNFDDRSRRIIHKDGVTKKRGFIGSKDFSNEEYDDQSIQDRDTALSSISFEMAGYQKWIVRNIESFTPDSILFGESLLNSGRDTNSVLRKDIKFFKNLFSGGRQPDQIVETLIPIGSEVFVIGTYLAKENIIVPGRWRSLRIINGNRSKVLENMEMDYWAWFVVGIILISIEIGGILYLTS